MTVKALEVLLNGKRLFTVGLKDWCMMGAQISGHRQTTEDIERIIAASDEPIPGLEPEGFESFHLYAYAGVPDSGDCGGSSGQKL